jgi:hypothetical protein
MPSENRIIISGAVVSIAVFVYIMLSGDLLPLLGLHLSGHDAIVNLSERQVFHGIRFANAGFPGLLHNRVGHISDNHSTGGSCRSSWHPGLQAGPNCHHEYSRPCQDKAGSRQEPFPEKPSRKTKD